MRTTILIITFLLLVLITKAQGSGNAIASGVISALLTGGVILFLIVMPIVVWLSRRKNESPEDNKIDSNLVDSNEDEPEASEEGEGVDGRMLMNGCVTLIICLVVGAIVVSMMFK